MQIRPQPLKAPPRIRKEGHPLQNRPLCGFAKDGLPCVCVVALAVVGAWFAFPAKSLIITQNQNVYTYCVWTSELHNSNPSRNYDSTNMNCFAGLVVKVSTSRGEDPVFESRSKRDFSWSSHTSDLNISTHVAFLPGAWRCRVRARTGRPSVSILWQGEVESLICSSFLSVAARILSEQIRPWDTLACSWDVNQPTNNINTHERRAEGHH